MRKLFSLFVALLATTTLWAWASDFQSGDLYYTITSSSQKTVEVVYIARVTTAIIPETVTYYGTTYSVTSIGDCAFQYCSSLTSITIPNNVTSIGWGAFEGTGIYKDESNWENDVLYIDNCLIEARTSISGTYAIKENTRLIADDAFSDCSSLTSITIPNSVTSIGDWAFYGCSSITSVTIGNSVTSIGDDAFSSCSSLTSITIPNSVTRIGNRAFADCSSLTSVTIGNSVTRIGYAAFYNCSSLNSITIPNSVTTVGGGMFFGCDKLESVVLSNNMISLLPCYSQENYIHGFFAGCSSLTSIAIPNSVTSIGEKTFYGCSSLTSITIPNSVTSIGGSAFNGCSSLTSITIPNSVTSIGGSAFYECSSLTSITIPNSVTSIGYRAFYGCSSLPVEDALRYADTYLVEAVNSRLSTYSIKEGTKWVGDEAFDYCSSLTSITIPNSVTSIGVKAFYECSSLTSVTIGNSVTSIGSSAFEDCSSLTSVTIPNSVTSIGEGAFYECSSLTSVTIGNSVTSIGGAAFYKCSSLTSVTIGNSVTSIGANAFHGCNIDSIILSASDIATFCQGNANDLLRQKDIKCPRKLLIKDVETKEVDIPNSVELINPYAFYNCIDLNKVSLSNSVKTIGNSAFAGCTGLNLLRLGTGIQSIAANAFANCTKLYDIYCLAAEPPTGYTSSFANYNAFIHVPCESQRLYMLDVLFGEFKYIECISSDEVTTDDIVITPGLTDVTIIWPSEDYADTYTIVIKKGNEVFCTLTFNADGQLLNIAFAPGRDGNRPAQYAEAVANGKGFRFTVTGLEEATDYTYDITVKDASNKTIKSHSGKFTTESLTAVENTHIQSPMTDCQKIIHNGQLLILRDGKIYTVMGQEL